MACSPNGWKAIRNQYLIWVEHCGLRSSRLPLGGGRESKRYFMAYKIFTMDKPLVTIYPNGVCDPRVFVAGWYGIHMHDGIRVIDGV